MDQLVQLSGIGRKTANVLLGACFGQPAVVVDTHLKRVTGRLGLARARDPDQVEAELRALIPEDRQSRFTWVIGEHGRQQRLRDGGMSRVYAIPETLPFRFPIV